MTGTGQGFSDDSFFVICFAPRPLTVLKFEHMCPNFSTLLGLGEKCMAKNLCLATFQLCLPETQVYSNPCQNRDDSVSMIWEEGH